MNAIEFDLETCSRRVEGSPRPVQNRMLSPMCQEDSDATVNSQDLVRSRRLWGLRYYGFEATTGRRPRSSASGPARLIARATKEEVTALRKNRVVGVKVPCSFRMLKMRARLGAVYFALRHVLENSMT